MSWKARLHLLYLLAPFMVDGVRTGRWTNAGKLSFGEYLMITTELWSHLLDKRHLRIRVGYYVCIIISSTYQYKMATYLLFVALKTLARMCRWSFIFIDLPFILDPDRGQVVK